MIDNHSDGMLQYPITIYRIRASLLLLSLLMLCGCGASQSVPSAPLRIAAASDLAQVMPELIALHQQHHPAVTVTTTLGSSGLLARQIAQGAPFDLLFSANVAFAEDLVARGHGRSDTLALYARGRIAMWSVAGGVEPALGLEDLRDPRFRRIALANPEHAPYGLAAKQALISAGLWEELAPRMVYAENILQTLQFCQSGNAEVAIIALALAIPTTNGAWALLDGDLHEPIDQGLVVTTQSQQAEAAAAFARTVNGPEGRAIMQRFGFVLPGEELDAAILEAAGGRMAR